jgi:peptidyl-prolyl cis-trans isomerase D
MIALFRRFLGTWAARVFFLLLVGSFGLWGIADVVRNLGQSGSTVATVGSSKVDVSELQDSYRRLLRQVQRQSGSTAEPSPETRRAVAGEALQRLVVQAEFAGEVARMGLRVPDAAVRQATFDEKAFHGVSGQFDRAVFQAALRNASLTEAHYLDLMRTDLGQRQLVEALRAGASVPDVVSRLVFAAQEEKRVADLVELPFAKAAEPPPPTDAQLQRQYDDNLNAYAAPEYRRVKAVVLSPDTLAHEVVVSDDELGAAYEARRASFGEPEKRSVEVVATQDEAAAKALATRWISGADWPAMEQAAKESGASSVQLDDTSQVQFPAADLASAVFAAAPDTVVGPEKTDLGFQSFRVTKVSPATARPFEAVRAELLATLQKERATDLVFDRANKVQDALAGGASLDDLPGDLGLAAVSGTLDSEGKTLDGMPAPLPGGPALQAAIVAKAFTLAQGDPAVLAEAPEQSFFAVTVEDITPAATRPFDAVRDRVRDDWVRDARRREQNVAAAKLLTAVKGGGSLADAARLAGLGVRHTPPVSRNQPTPGIPAELVQPLFAAAKGEATMVEDTEGFWVAVLTDIQTPDPAADPAALGRIGAQLSRAVGDDIEISYAAALRARDKPTINRALLDSVTQ